MDPFMKRAIGLALENVRRGGLPFGAVLVHDGRIVSEAVNEWHKTFDVTGHAEVLAVRRAQEQLQTHDLSGHTMYASGEPCPMCLTAMYYARIDKVYYCLPAEAAAGAGIGMANRIEEDLRKPPSERRLPLYRLPLEDGLENPVELWKSQRG